MELKNVIQWLLDQKYGLIIGSQFIVTQKLQSELFKTPLAADYIAMDEVSSNPKIVQVTTKLVQKVASPDEKKTIWNQFVERADIPHRVKASDGGIYTVRQYSPAAVLVPNTDHKGS